MDLYRSIVRLAGKVSRGEVSAETARKNVREWVEREWDSVDIVDGCTIADYWEYVLRGAVSKGKYRVFRE